MAGDGQPFLVQAVYSFKGKNNDELCFKKGDIITVTQMEDGGWWEGTFGDKTGWFPSNYVKEYKTQTNSLSPVMSAPVDLTAQQKVYRSVVLKDLTDSERAHVTELQGLMKNFLQPLEKTEVMKPAEYQQLVGNLADVIEVHEELLNALDEVSTRSASEQRVGRVFISAAPRLKQVLMTYCGSHPRAVCVLERYKQELTTLMEANGAASPGLLVLTTGLSKPFRRLEKYAGMLTELERHVEESHVDRGDTQRSVSVYKDIASTCSVIRRQKEMELEVVSGGVRGWEGEDLANLGDIIHMGSVAVGADHRDRYLVLFPTTLLMLSVSHRMSAFIYEGKLPLTGISINKLEDTDLYKNAFEIVGPMIDRIVAVCQTKEDQDTWLELIRQQIRNVRVSSPPPPTSPTARPVPPPHSPVSSPYSRLAAHFARLVRRGVITRKLLKHLLYYEFNKGVNTDGVIRRRRGYQRTECIIYPQEAVRTYIHNTDSSSDDDSSSDSEDSLNSNRCNLLSASVSKHSSDDESRASSFGYVRGAYRSTLTIGKADTIGCHDLTKLDSNTAMPATLRIKPMIAHSVHHQSLPVVTHNVTRLTPTHSSCLVLPPTHTSVAEIIPEPVSSATTPTTNSDEIRPLHRSYSYHFVGENSGCQCSESYRSSDSGLADITSPDLTTPGPDLSLPHESEESGNFEAQCVCSSPFGSTPRTSPQPTSTTPTTLTTPTYRSGMYAHWCLKMKIPASSVKTPTDDERK